MATFKTNHGALLSMSLCAPVQVTHPWSQAYLGPSLSPASVINQMLTLSQLWPLFLPSSPPKLHTFDHSLFPRLVSNSDFRSLLHSNIK